MTQDQLADYCGVTQTTVGRWKKGTVPAGDDLVKIANRFGQSIDWLMGREVGVPAEPVREVRVQDPLVDKALGDAAEIREKVKALEQTLRQLKKY